MPIIVTALASSYETLMLATATIPTYLYKVLIPALTSVYESLMHVVITIPILLQLAGPTVATSKS